MAWPGVTLPERVALSLCTSGSNREPLGVAVVAAGITPSFIIFPSRPPNVEGLSLLNPPDPPPSGVEGLPLLNPPGPPVLPAKPPRGP